MKDHGGGSSRPGQPPGPDPAAAPARPLREVAAAIVIHGDRVLVQRRPEGKSWCGWWEFPGGKLEPGESARACVERECLEELDLRVQAREPIHDVTWEYPGVIVHVTFVLCAAANDPRAQGTPAAVSGSTQLPATRALEGQELMWATFGDLRTLVFLPANAGLLPLLASRLRGSAPLSSA